jgi:hypothetical protein
VSDPHRPIPAAPPFEVPEGATGKADWNKDIKSYYDAIVNEPVPNEIEALMATLAKAIRK